MSVIKTWCVGLLTRRRYYSCSFLVGCSFPSTEWSSPTLRSRLSLVARCSSVLTPLPTSSPSCSSSPSSSSISSSLAPESCSTAPSIHLPGSSYSLTPCQSSLHFTPFNHLLYGTRLLLRCKRNSSPTHWDRRSLVLIRKCTHDRIVCCAQPVRQPGSVHSSCTLSRLTNQWL